MRLRYTAAILIAFLLLFAGCSKKENNQETAPPSYTEKYTVVSETDIKAYYSMPKFKNLADESVQDSINKLIDEYISDNSVNSRKSKAIGMISESDISEYSFSELGNYKVHCLNEEYMSFSLSIEQRFSDDDETISVRQNFLYNYDSETGELFDVSSLFKNKNLAGDYIARELYDRLRNMNCLTTDDYSEEVFKKNIFEYCAIVDPKSKVAVVTTAGEFGLKLSAGAPIVEISVPEEYFI